MLLERIRHSLLRYSKLIRAWRQITYYNLWVRFHQKRQLDEKLNACKSPNHLYDHQSDPSRCVEMLSEDQSWKEVVVTCYFTGKPDPQTGKKRNSASFDYIEPWYTSMKSLSLNGVILHDGLEESFISKYQTAQIQFRKCTLGKYSIFEERWLLYHIFIKQLPALTSVVFSDSNDVMITGNPFHFMFAPKCIYVGRDNANRMKDSEWLFQEMTEYCKESGTKVSSSYPYQWVYNAGVVGGCRKIMFFLTAKMADKIFLAYSTKHKDMSLLNLVIHEHFYPRLSLYRLDRKLVEVNDDLRAVSESVFTGFPFNSGFKAYDTMSKAYFIHK